MSRWLVCWVLKTSCLLPRKGRVCRCHLRWKIKCSSHLLLVTALAFKVCANERNWTVFIWKYKCLKDTCDCRKKKDHMILGRQSAIPAACTQNPTLCSDRKMDRPVSSTWRCVCSAFTWLTRKQRPQGWESLHLSHLHATGALWESPKKGLSWVDLTEKKTGISCWYEHSTDSLLHRNLLVPFYI